MDGFKIDRSIAEKMAGELADMHYGKDSSISKQLCIQGTLLYSLEYEERGLVIESLMSSAGLENCSDQVKAHAVVVYAACEQFLADLDWAWEHFDARIGLDSIEQCKKFVAAQEQV